MKKNPQKKENKDVVDGWMGTYGDMVTLLFAFFVLLYAMSDPDPGKFEEFSQAMKEAFSQDEIQNEFENLEENLKEIMKEKDLTETVKVELHPEGVQIQMEGSSLFNMCSADIRPNMEPVIANIATAITDLLDESSYDQYFIEVKGHTDNLPPTNCKDFDSNWALSSIRATGVLEKLLEKGINKYKLQAIGLADSQPLFPNMDENGLSIKENQAKNRRVEIYINKFE
tara:strand:- start:680 stop:1360 length:681 start_codon:yes stop_codon:yes gene_type:complete